jgi:hypothetical protein
VCPEHVTHTQRVHPQLARSQLQFAQPLEETYERTGGQRAEEPIERMRVRPGSETGPKPPIFLDPVVPFSIRGGEPVRAGDRPRISEARLYSFR